MRKNVHSQRIINIQVKSPDGSSSLVLIEATAEKTLADTLVPQNGFEVIEDFDEMKQTAVLMHLSRGRALSVVGAH